MAALLATLLAHDTAKATLERALTNDRVHHAYLFDGADGVGKEVAALGLAQALVCERRPPRGPTACGECSACLRTVVKAGSKRPVHPDVVILERGLYSPEQIGRRTPETQDLSIDQVRTLVLAHAAFPPHEGKARVYIVRRAEELSISAANALLKTLEEPPSRTHFILLSSRSESLLSTIRSRTQRVRFGRLPDAVVARLLVHAGTSESEAKKVAALAHGSMSEAVVLADPEATSRRDEVVRTLMAALDGDDGGRLGRVLEVAEEAKKQKDMLDTHFAALAQRLADDACREVRSGGSGATPAARYESVLTAMRQLDGNAAAQLVTEALLLQMSTVRG
jgi:DNA polymerase-3 subunit delta'